MQWLLLKGGIHLALLILFIHTGLPYNHQCHVKSSNNGFPHLFEIAYVFLKAGYISLPRFCNA